ncbi:MAG: DUF6364 family protein [Bacteroidia bacterium]|nr:DUF6364 family protein [Bacteroidia bacterium]MDW8347686.1 DUF6364 family protein [Bacteroidia bacterium]
MSKISIALTDELAKKAKEYARKKQTTISFLIENYLKMLIEQDKNSTEEKTEVEITPIVKSLKGAFSYSECKDDGKELSLELTKKYL